MQLLKTLERRQAETGTGFLDLYETVYHWAYDFMVRVLHLLSIISTYFQPYPKGDMVFGGRSKIVRCLVELFGSPHLNPS